MPHKELGTSNLVRITAKARIIALKAALCCRTPPSRRKKPGLGPMGGLAGDVVMMLP